MPYNEPPDLEFTFVPEKPDHQAELERALCERDYSIVEAYHPALLIAVEKAVNEGCTPQQIRRWAQNVTKEDVILQRVFNAARWLAGAK